MAHDPIQEMLNGFRDGRVIERRVDQARRDGIEKGFAFARKRIASLLRQEGFVDAAARVERLKIERKRST